MSYVFGFPLTAVDMAILTQSGAMPHPAGVDVTIISVDGSKTFGFNGSGCQPFNQGTFYDGVIHVA